MGPHAIVILRADGTKEQTSILAGETRISAEGFVFRATEDGVTIEIGRGVVPLPYGSFVPDGVVAWDSEVTIGDTKVRIGEPQENTPLPGGAPTRPPQKTSPVVVVCGALSVAVLAWLVFGESESTGLRPPPPAPPLFDDVALCPTSPAEPNALRIAERSERAARAMLQRYPFAPADGVKAVDLFRRSAACWSDAGFVPSSNTATARADRLQQRVIEDYDTSQLLLFRALGAGHVDEARAEVAILLALLGDRSDPYVDWLREVERTLRARSGRGRRRS